MVKTVISNELEALDLFLFIPHPAIISIYCFYDSAFSLCSVADFYYE